MKCSRERSKRCCNWPTCGPPRRARRRRSRSILRNCCGRCVANLQPAATKRAIVIVEELSSAPVRVIPDHAVMILDNILLNAITYSRDGGQVSIVCQARPEGGGRVTVRDRGIGIPADKLPRIFEDYFRTTEAAQHNRASTGLGLAIVPPGGARRPGGNLHPERARTGDARNLGFPRGGR